MDRKNKKCSCARKSGRRKNNAGTDKEEEKKLTGPLAKKELPPEGCSRRNGKLEECWGRRRFHMIDNIMINRLYEDTKRKAEKMVEWRMLSLQWKTYPSAEHYDWFIDCIPLGDQRIKVYYQKLKLIVLLSFVETQSLTDNKITWTKKACNRNTWYNGPTGTLFATRHIKLAKEKRWNGNSRGVSKLKLWRQVQSLTHRKQRVFHAEASKNVILLDFSAL